jgi:general secretion pathway protein B
MSVILDVLKKLDREKSSRRSAAANIALEILKPDPPRSQKRNPLYFATVGLTALAAAAITYALMGSGLMNPPTTSQEIATTPRDPVSLPKSSLPPAKSPPAPSQRVAPDPPPLESGRDAREGISRVPPEVRTPAENKIPAISPVEKEAVPAPPQKAPDTSVITPPSLKISAIIWYEDPSKRFAMINDTMTHEGSVIEEVMVEEIYPNRVRFSHNGRHFEISVK